MVSGSNVLNLIECHQKSIINIGAAAAASGAVVAGKHHGVVKVIAG